MKRKKWTQIFNKCQHKCNVTSALRSLGYHFGYLWIDLDWWSVCGTGRTKAKWNRAVCNVHRAAILAPTHSPAHGHRLSDSICCLSIVLRFHKIQPLQLVIISFSLANEWHRMIGAFFGHSFNFRFFSVLWCGIVSVSKSIEFVKCLFRTWRRDEGPGDWCRRWRKSVLYTHQCSMWFQLNETSKTM